MRWTSIVLFSGCEWNLFIYECLNTNNEWIGFQPIGELANPIFSPLACTSYFLAFPSSPHDKLLWQHSCLGWHVVCFRNLCTTSRLLAPSTYELMYSKNTLVEGYIVQS
jgi:hypothetical protein